MAAGVAALLPGNHHVPSFSMLKLPHFLKHPHGPTQVIMFSGNTIQPVDRRHISWAKIIQKLIISMAALTLDISGRSCKGSSGAICLLMAGNPRCLAIYGWYIFYVLHSQESFFLILKVGLFKSFKKTFCSIIFVLGPIAGGFFQNKEKSSLCHARHLHHWIIDCCSSCAEDPQKEISEFLHVVLSKCSTTMCHDACQCVSLILCQIC